MSASLSNRWTVASVTHLGVAVLLMAGLLPARAATAGTSGMVRVPAGELSLFFDKNRPPVAVPEFELDATPVTNAAFLEFVTAAPAWRRSEVPRVRADETYLKHWQGDLSLGPLAQPNGPVTYVSWFAARAYCAARGARLPTLAEWEHAARADERSFDAARDPVFRERILAWHAAPLKLPLPPVASGYRNVHGAWDMHGSIWEWVVDFGAALVGQDARSPGADLVCGAGAAQSIDSTDYAAFKRYAVRGSLKARHTLASLGFRCARDLAGGSR